MVQGRLVRIFSECLNDADRHAIFGAIEDENFFAGVAALFLFPLEDFFDSGVFDDGDALVVVEKPLNYVGNGIDIDAPLSITAERRFVCRRRSAITRSSV